MRIAISTPTGQIGNQITKQLLEQGEHNLILLAREPAKLDNERAMGATVVKADLTNGATFVGPLTDADAFFFLIPQINYLGKEREIFNQIATNVAQAINQSNVSRIVFLSSLGAHHSEGTGGILGLHDAEQILRGLKADITILRPGYFMENCLWYIDSILKEGAIKQPISGSAKMSFIATRDIATKAVELLTDTSWKGIHIREIVGPVMTFDEVATTIGKECGRDVRHVKLTATQVMAQVEAGTVGFHADYVPEYIDSFECMEKGLLCPEFPESAEKISLTSLAEFARTELVPLFDKSAKC